MARQTAAQKREIAAAAKAALPTYNQDDKVEFKIVGTLAYIYTSYNGEKTYTVETDTGYEWEISPSELADSGVTLTVTEAAPFYAHGTVIKDAEGCVFRRDSDEWVGMQDSCETPTKPYTVATFA